eukprot:TRINITY_DN90524_c0_g1_i1.p1 TRINITY_DN90524_c0_g1~~TRINITY_DN90524_c0_g1_i1.p1  ORF type:complete len:610 (-),score=124.22 TRINITY_DN90524_c0_g1_i1:241-2070(-)
MKRALTASGAPIPTYEEIKNSIEKRLFITRLPPSTTEYELREVFGRHGQLQEVRLILDKGLAFVGFENWASAQKALLSTDNQCVLRGCNGTPIAVSFADRTGSANRGGVNPLAKGMDHCRMFVKGLPDGVSQEDFKMLVTSFGQVVESYFTQSLSGRIALAKFSFWGEALDCIELLDGQKYPGTVSDMTAGFADDAGNPVEANSAGTAGGAALAKAPRVSVPVTNSGDPEFDSIKQAYLAAIDGEFPEEVCHELHNKIMASRPKVRAEEAAAQAAAAQVVAAQAAQAQAAAAATAIQQQAGLSLNLNAGSDIVSQALAALTQAGQLDTALAQLGAMNSAAAGLAAGLPGLGLEELALAQGLAGALPAISFEDRDAARLFVGGLPNECTETELRALVDQVGFSPAIQPHMNQLLECRVLPNRGCGYIKYSSWEAAQEALACLDNRSVAGWKEPLRVRWATPKNQLSGGATLNGITGGLGSGLGTGNYDALGSTLKALCGGEPTSAIDKFKNGIIANGNGEGGDIKSKGQDPKRLFIGQIRREMNDRNMLLKLFEPFGHMISLRWLEDKGVAYVQYSDHPSASAAVHTLNSKDIPGVSCKGGLSVKYSNVR